VRPPPGLHPFTRSFHIRGRVPTSNPVWSQP